MAIVGAGGKTSTLRRLAESLGGKVVITTSTHMGMDQIETADKKIFLRDTEELLDVEWGNEERICSITSPPIDGHRLSGLTEDQLSKLYELSVRRGFSILIEADGAKMLPLKAPAEHEPVIPEWVDAVVVVAGMSALGKHLNAETVFRPELFGSLACMAQDEIITGDRLAKALSDPCGSLKNIPPKARRILCLNQAENLKMHPEIMRVANYCKEFYDQIIICSLGYPRVTPEIYARIEKTAAIILAAGGSTRMNGVAKPLVEFGGVTLLGRAILTAKQSELSPVIVVVGYQSDRVTKTIPDNNVEIVVNDGWEKGQSTSIKAGLRKLADRSGAAIFMLVDQPFVSAALIERLRNFHMTTMTHIVAPIVDDIRSNPVLFDRVTFGKLLGLEGDTGGRAIMGHFSHQWIPWLDKRLLMDIDTPEDLVRCMNESSK